MGKGKKLNREEKHQVQALAKLGTMSSRQIAVQVGVSPSSVQRVLKRSPHITNVKAGRKEKLDDRQKRALTRYISKNPTSSAETAKRVLNFPCSAQTVRRMLHKSQFANIKMIKEKGLSKKNQEKRVNFARDHVAWIDDWQRVIFSDEKKWNLTGPDGWARMWVQTGRNTNMAQFSQTMKSIMVWGAISASGPLVLVLMKGKYDSRKYIEMIDTNLFSAADSLFPANSVFQQDNAPIHVSKHSLGWLEEHEIDTMAWPPQSPDLSPIENIWALLSQRVYANGRVFATTKELWESLKEEWGKLTAADMAPYYAGMHNRMVNVLLSNGKKIPH